jgi:mRNA-degrading endonuclease RelE of RelBE toxin-antitoxin system
MAYAVEFSPSAGEIRDRRLVVLIVRVGHRRDVYR